MGRSLRLAVTVGIAAAAVLLAPASPALAGINAWGFVSKAPFALAKLQTSPAIRSDHTMFAAWYATGGMGDYDPGGVARSTDSGRTWSKVGPPGVDRRVTSIRISPAYALDRTVFATTVTTADRYEPGILWRSTDGGTSWTRLAVDLSGSDSLELSPAFATDGSVAAAVDSGVATGDGLGMVGLSTDRGTRWTRPFIPSADVLSDVAVVSGTELFAASRGAKLRSTDAGVHWSVEGTGPLTANGVDSVGIASIAFVGDNGWLIDSELHLQRSRDRGATWAVVPVTTGEANTYLGSAIDFGDASHGVMAGGRDLLFTTDGGDTWKRPTVPDSWGTSIKDVHFTGPLDAWATGTSNPAPETALWHSKDGGATWTAVATPALDEWGGSGDGLAIDFSSDDCGWLVTEHDHNVVVFRSPDGGVTWSKVLERSDVTPANGGEIGFKALSAAGAVLSCERYDAEQSVSSCVMLVTDDEGATWREATGPATSFARTEIEFVSATQGIALNYMSPPVTTSDGGKTWAGPPGVAGLRPGALRFSPSFASDGAMMAQLTGDYERPGGTFLSRDRGWSWNRFTALPGAPGGWVGFSPAYASDKTLFAMSGTGGDAASAANDLYRSTDAGASWKKLPMRSAPAISPAFATDNGLFAVAGVSARTLGYTSALQTYISLNRGDTWVALGASGSYTWDEPVTVPADFGASGTIYTIWDGRLCELSMRAPRAATLSKPSAKVGWWDRRWVGWPVRIEGTIVPAHPNGGTVVGLSFEKLVGRRWVTYKKIHPFTIDYKGRSKPVASASMELTEVLAKAGSDYGWTDYVMREKGTFRVRMAHDDHKLLGGHTLSTSSWTTYVVK